MSSTCFSWSSFIPTAGAADVGLPQYNICKYIITLYITLYIYTDKTSCFILPDGHHFL